MSYTPANRAYRGHFLADSKEFLRALGDPYTYWPGNPDFVFGFLWGIPIPVVTMTVHLYAANIAISPAAYTNLLQTYPLYFIFVLHPLLFAIIFGALGTKICRRDERISELLSVEEQRNRELCEANARLTEVDRLKSEFLANVTHELKSPLVTALGYTDRILGKHLGEINDKQIKGLEVSKRNLQRLRGLIDEILDFSRLEAGVARFDMTTVDLKGIVAIALENIALKARERKLSITPHLPPGVAAVDGDAHKLCQVITNLLDNALKFSPDGAEVRLEISPADKQWHISVVDQGKGIPPHVLCTLFERFRQADGSLSRPHNGVGLGLVIVKKIVQAHHGKVWLESAEGKGTTAHVLLLAAGTDATGEGNSSELKEVAHADHFTD
ncbi:MAG TPA: HAMP domain-containing sensor histidine kinase [Planctomycetota bacterium]|nr:HAMP domain-containing sensor histidine kinase [Planctomycetota bacterium]